MYNCQEFRVNTFLLQFNPYLYNDIYKEKKCRKDRILVDKSFCSPSKLLPKTPDYPKNKY